MEVQPRATRRRFTAAYKRQIVEQAEAIIEAQKKRARLLESQQEDETP
jgi:hypothetical protein